MLHDPRRASAPASPRVNKPLGTHKKNRWKKKSRLRFPQYRNVVNTRQNWPYSNAER